MSSALLTRWIAGAMILCATASAEVPSDVEIRKILSDRIGAENLGVGIVVGVIDSGGRRVVTYGSLAKNDDRRLAGDTVFEIGSVSKVFTSLVLMDMVRRGEVALTDPVSKYLPDTVKLPERNGRKITLADLSTQSSGLPRMPSNFTPKDPNNPYADYTVQQMYDFLSGYQLTRDIGAQYEYSNLGVGLLGHVLALRAGMTYEALVRARICDPLGMTETRITLTPEMKARLAVGHNSGRSPVSNWDLPTLAGAGALRSTANDLLTFLAANLGYTKTPLAAAMADEVSIRKPVGAGMEIAYGWHVQTNDDGSIIWHNGGTGGYRTYVGFDPKARTGVVVLTNLSTAEGGDDIGRHLLHASYPLAKVKPPVEHKEIALDSKTFDRYVGTYRLTPSLLLTVSRDGDRFYAQVTGQPKVEMFAETERAFFLKVVDAQFTFDSDAARVVLHQNGADTAGKRLSEEEARSAAEAIEKRMKESKPSPGTEEAVRRLIQEVQKGEPDYERMSTPLADLTRQQLPQLKAAISQFGPVKSVTFKGAGPGGMDIYEVVCEHAKSEWRIVLGGDGKIAGVTFRPL